MVGSTVDTRLITEQFKKKISKAMKHPYVWPEIDNLVKNEQQFAQKFLFDKLDKKEFEHELTQLQLKTPSLIVNSLLELEMIMHVLRIDEVIKTDTLADMRFKYDKALKQGYQCRFSVWFYKPMIKDGIAMYCATQIKI